MKSIKKSVWKVKPSATPLYIAKCSKCKENRLYYCSEKFRVNAQKRRIDVWLIYKCEKCDNTYNVTVISRCNPENIDKKLYYNFLNNDVNTAWKYSFDKGNIKRNKVNVDYSHIEFDIEWDEMSLEEMTKVKEDLIEYEIKIDYSISLKLTKIIRKCLKISILQLKNMLSSGVITVYPQVPIKKCKIKDGVIVVISREKLKKYLEKEQESKIEEE